MSDAPKRKMLTPNGALPTGNWPENELVPWVPEDVALAMVAAERERCARVAETSHERWHDELTAHEVECDYTACQDIAAAIRRGDG